MAQTKLPKRAVAVEAGPRVLLGLGFVGLIAGGCAQIIGADWGSYEGGEGTSTGTQGGGGCEDPLTDCPATGTECVMAVCDNGACVEQNVAEGTPLASQPGGSCHEVQCDGAGETVDVVLAEQTECTENGGAVCNVSGECVECVDGTKCASGNCEGTMCVGTCGTVDVAAEPLSCASRDSGAGNNCGADNFSCCENKLVPCGTYLRSYDGDQYDDASYPATVSDFRLDTYEVTVGRFRAFVEAGGGTLDAPPAAGAGEHEKIAGSGWDATWNQYLAADTAALKLALDCSATYATWTDTPGSNEKLPMNCMTWYEAFAFCVWDGGRLPTEAEWNYAAAGGGEQRKYPWGSGVADSMHAVYGCTGDGSPAGECALTDIMAVGSKPNGNGLWGQADLAGSMWEWTLDYYDDSYATPCNDCAQLSNATLRVVRGGSFYYDASYLLSAFRGDGGPTLRYDGIGARCARTQ